MTVVIPTLEGGELLAQCLRSLEKQTVSHFEIVIVDNSAQKRVGQLALPKNAFVIENETNRGFGGAVNQAVRRARTPYIALLNDDAWASPVWLEALLQAIESRPRTGMCASRVILAEGNRLDSAGMLLCGDGSSRQRGHGRPPEEYALPAEVLFPSGSAALYRRQMLEEIGGFDESFFLYCEDTDLGLRALWAGWSCLYVPDAVAFHHYSSTAGAASPMKAYYVERNRLFVLVKNFPLRMLARAPLLALQRYFWHVISMLRGRGAAGRFRTGSPWWLLVLIVLRAHLALLKHGRRLLRQRAAIRRSARITASEFARLCRRHSISPRQVAAL